MALDIQAYVKRISYSEPLEVDLSTLRSLHRQHLFTVPFENLDVHRKKMIELDIDKLEQKIIFNYRGGFCYELNSLFGELLRQIGFDVHMISASVYNDLGICGPEFDHLALVITLEDKWLVDVGFGKNFIEPIQFEVGVAQRDTASTYKIDQVDDFFQMSSSKNGKDFLPRYQFSKKQRKLANFEDMCNYHQTSPDSIFTQNRICTLATENGRKTLSGMEYLVTHNQHKSRILLKDDGQFREILTKEFGILL